MEDLRTGVALPHALMALSLAASFAVGCQSGSDGCVATAEVCNGADDDCDGEIDEGFDVGGPCTAGVGACARTGATVCAGGGGAACDAAPGAPAVEACNQLDDDCDGQTDEDLAGCCTPAATRACGADVGACTLGTEACSGAGAWGPCVDGDGAPVVLPGTMPESCNGMDDDCDGATDEDLPVVACPLQLGVCAGSAMACEGANGWACHYEPGYESDEVSCNGLDDDCDGQTDENLMLTSYRDADADGWGAMGSMRQDCAIPSGNAAIEGDCDDSNASVHVGATELCGNGLDDNCDGLTDSPDDCTP